MSDLVKRLRAHADGLGPLGAPVVAKDIREAADELKRLTAEIAKLRQIEVDGDFEIERRAKEIERLKLWCNEGATGDYRDRLYGDLVRRGYAQHEARALSYGHHLAVIQDA